MVKQQGALVKCTCKVCGTKFVAYSMAAKYCSIACQDKWHREHPAKKNPSMSRKLRDVYVPDMQRRQELEAARRGFRAPAQERDHVINSTIRVTKRGDH